MTGLLTGVTWSDVVGWLPAPNPAYTPLTPARIVEELRRAGAYETLS